ncbi:MAG: bifunctional (p)ppGpp synthetase/guanosine-3',5'-bis(diphosphate) 3'-pyrophosphohydrolase [Myxococcales bacterium]|nr:bifunctional (p)ppGpp synthetase/guanosine-3',5'-bis(diphosphate) 3'-pyrophosphohydrolase [Myxococcales bacterium]MCB9713701.1 bifunctional (p)ppGpp synthetase/guanosine-3',5'-bis(diphosphate) 3'-pyrophosphohydrolase [Myxococcales bacterium]
MAPASESAPWGGPGWGPTVPPVTEESLHDGRALHDLLAELRSRQSHPDEGLIARAFELARRAHSEQRRKSGEPYLIHPVRVAHGIAQLGLDSPSVAAGLLHDAVEDSELTVFELTEQFGREVAAIVDGVTKLGKVPYLSKATQQAESFRKMLLAMSRDIRVLIVKLLDRLDNMRTLEHMAADKQERISRETMQIYAPLANRLGLEGVRRELQDLSFRYLEPVSFAAVRKDIEGVLLRHPGQPEASLSALRKAFDGSEAPRPGRAELGQDRDESMRWPAASGRAEVRATLRTPYRVHRRREANGRTLELSDIVTFQVITRDRGACYAALGLLHSHFQPIPGRFRDYIALPRPNHYRGLHTSLVGRDGNRLEIQIRSQSMDDVARRGIAAAWKDGRHPGGEAEHLAWLRGLMDWQDDVRDPAEFIEAVKADLFADEIYVFTPGGDVHTFPKGATPIDFSFAIHTDVGMHCSGARVNGQAVPLRYHLRQGDTVEIITNPNHGPRAEWMSMCVTSRAKAKIRQHLRHQERQHLREVGRSLVEQVLRGRGLEIDAYERSGAVAERADELGLPRDSRDTDGVYAAIGAGQVEAEALVRLLVARDAPAEPTSSEGSLVTRLIRRVTRFGAGEGKGTALGADPAAPTEITRDKVTAPGGGRALIELAPCCSPVPGDSLVGVFEAGRGITAHVEGCPEIVEQISGRRVFLKWEPELELERPVTIEVRTANMVGLLAEMSRAFSKNDVNIKQANCRALPDGDRAINTFQATVSSLQQLEALMATLKAIDGVLGVERVFSPGSSRYGRS